MRDGTSELHVAALHALLETATGAVDAFAERYCQRVAWLRTFLSHVDDEGATPSSKLCNGHISSSGEFSSPHEPVVGSKYGCADQARRYSQMCMMLPLL